MCWDPSSDVNKVWLSRVGISARDGGLHFRITRFGESRVVRLLRELAAKFKKRAAHLRISKGYISFLITPTWSFIRIMERILEQIPTGITRRPLDLEHSNLVSENSERPFGLLRPWIMRASTKLENAIVS